MILTGWVERTWDRRCRPVYSFEPRLVAVDNTSHALAGRGGEARQGKPPLVHTIEDSSDGQDQPEYFAFRCYLNGKLHLEFLRLHLVKELNCLTAGESVLGVGLCLLPGGGAKVARPERIRRKALLNKVTGSTG